MRRGLKKCWIFSLVVFLSLTTILARVPPTITTYAEGNGFTGQAVDLYGSAPKENIISKNPLFVDAENGNFQLYKDSPAVGAGDDGSDLGDPRLGVST